MVGVFAAMLFFPYPAPEGIEHPARGEYDPMDLAGIDYLAIGPQDFGPVLEPLLEWKAVRGLRCAFHPLDGVDGILNITSFKGRDRAETIRNFIVWAYNASKDGGRYAGIRWVLLAGDSEFIPARLVFVNHSAEFGSDDPNNYVATDFYYAGLDGDWDQNGNGVFGENRLYGGVEEQDLDAEVYVGRFPASDAEELSIMVERQLRYETDPPEGPWASSMLLSGSLMDRPNEPDDPYTPVDEGYNDYKDNAFKLVKNITKVLPENVAAFSLLDYPQDRGGGYNRLFDTLNRSSFLDHYEMGFSTAMIACHGDENGNCTNYKGEGGGNLHYFADYEVHFNYNDAQYIDNGHRNPLLYISNCDSLDFTEEDDTNMERIMLNRNGGAIGIIGATTETYRGETRPRDNLSGSYGNWWLAEEYFRLLYHQTPRPGEALYLQKWNYEVHIWNEMQPFTPEWFRIFRIESLAYNLLGDPEGPIWLEEPRSMEIAASDPHIVTNETATVFVKDPLTGQPIEGAGVHLSYSDDASNKTFGRTDRNGKAVLVIPKKDLSDFTLTVTHDRYRPGTVYIEVVSLINVGVMKPVIDPEIPNAGDETTFTVTIYNDGSMDVENFILRMTLEDGSSRKNTNIWDISRLSPGETMEFSQEFDAYPGRNTFTAELIFLFNPVESDPDDNAVSASFISNTPIRFLKGDIPSLIEWNEDSSLSEDAGPFPLWFYIDDPDGRIDISMLSIGDIVGRITPEFAEDQNGNPVLDMSPDPNWFGKGSVEILATDGLSEDRLTLNISVRPVPDKPLFMSYPQRIEAREDEPAFFHVQVVDPDDDAVRLESPQDWINITKLDDEGNFNISFNPGEDLVGSRFITLVATDESGLSTNLQIPIIVEDTNDPPRFQLPGSITIRAGRSFLLPLQVEDDSKDPELNITADWEYQTVRTNSTALEIRAPPEAKRGSYELTVTISDIEGASTTRTMTVNVEKTDRAILPINIIVALSVLVISLLIGYGVFIRVQEKRQSDYLTNVGTGSSMDAPELSVQDFEEGRKEGIPMPPSDLEEEIVPVEEDEIIPIEDLEGDIDDVIGEFYKD
ncbi:MAG: C25 family cysteine peptidase [Candidatus Thermoplasmatota archaeon]|nr:C25 family cysteine peptidase [Candidatus Thermoplasmatota archaeon]